MLFLLAVNHSVTSAGDYSVGLPTDVDPEDVFDAIASFNAHLQITGAWVFAGGLEPVPEGATIDVSGSHLQLVDARRPVPQEVLGGFWIIDVPDRDTAMDWGRRASAACRQPVQVRPFQRRSAA